MDRMWLIEVFGSRRQCKLDGANVGAAQLYVLYTSDGVLTAT